MIAAGLAPFRRVPALAAIAPREYSLTMKHLSRIALPIGMALTLAFAICTNQAHGPAQRVVVPTNTPTTEALLAAPTIPASPEASSCEYVLAHLSELAAEGERWAVWARLRSPWPSREARAQDGARHRTSRESERE